MGVLAAAASLPYLLIGLQAGAVADRRRHHRPVMVACEAISAAAMASIPLAWIAGLLTVPWLIAVTFAVGSCAAVFRAFTFPHLTSVVHESQRPQALAGFQSAYSLAIVGGPSLAGTLVQLVTAPFAMLVNAVSFLASAFLIQSIKAPETHTPAERRGMWTEIREGLAAVAGHPVLRALCGTGIVINFFGSAYMALFVIYAITVLALPSGLIGALTAVFGVGGLLGAAVTARLVKRVGEDRMLIYAVLIFPLDFVTAALASGPTWAKFALMSASTLITGMAVVAFSVCLGAIVLREAPAPLLGRVNATMVFTTQGVLALGGLAGGLLGELLGLRPVLWICAAGVVLAIPLIWSSPLGPASGERADPAGGGRLPSAAVRRAGAIVRRTCAAVDPPGTTAGPPGAAASPPGPTTSSSGTAAAVRPQPCSTVPRIPIGSSRTRGRSHPCECDPANHHGPGPPPVSHVRRPHGPAAPARPPIGPAHTGLSGTAAPPRWHRPLSGRLQILRRFSPPPQPWLAGHRGVDLAAAPGAEVRSAGPGRVGHAARSPGAGSSQ
nr:hypothetical protein GCM10020093_099860 [Planobispora longispora]